MQTDQLQLEGKVNEQKGGKIRQRFDFWFAPERSK
jgi:hypothetical protein